VSVASGARGRQKEENQLEWGRGRRGRSRLRLPLRHAGGKHEVGVAQALVGPEGGREARPRKLRQCSTVPGGPLVRAGRGVGGGEQARSGPEIHEVSSRAPAVDTNPG